MKEHVTIAWEVATAGYWTILSKSSLWKPRPLWISW